ncbi:NifU-like protein 1, chloroplastic [Galdieria sulphuraria]|nr:NifU-like protein 1, chloroplastic [Galdieria sulphuraria]
MLLFLHSCGPIQVGCFYRTRNISHTKKGKLLVVPQCWKASVNKDFKDAPFSSNYIIDDNSIPEGHRSLHETLYSRGEEEHKTPSKQQVKFRSDGSNWLPVDLFLNGMEDEKVGAVYAVYDANRDIRFIGISRDVCFALKAHREALSDRDVAWLRLKTWDFPRRVEMEQCQKDWIAELGFTPPGNITTNEESKLWAKSIKEATQLVASDVEPERKSTYEEKKFKLRKAMADPSLIDEESREIFERDPTIHAISEGDWSKVIEQQSNKVLQDAVTSPFESVEVVANNNRVDERSNSNTAESGSFLTVENVNLVLDEVRPYLESDGGNVKVLSVDTNRNVVLLLQERILRQRFPNIGEIVAQSEVASVTTIPLEERCESLLEEIRPAIIGLGGSISVSRVENNQVFLLYQGPDKIKYGIELALKEKLGSSVSIVFE